MTVYTLGENLKGQTIVVENNVIRFEGIDGHRVFECKCKTLNNPYYLKEEKEQIYLTIEDAQRAIHEILHTIAV